MFALLVSAICLKNRLRNSTLGLLNYASAEFKRSGRKLTPLSGENEFK